MLTRFKVIRIAYLLDQFHDPRDLDMAANIQQYFKRHPEEKDENTQKTLDMYLRPSDRAKTLMAHINTLELKSIHEEITKVHPEHAEKFLSYTGRPPKRLISKLNELKKIGLIVDYAVGTANVDLEARYVDFIHMVLQ